MEYFDDLTFSEIDYSGQKLPLAEYDSCTFSDCDFSGTNLSGQRFSKCHFVRCNFSLAKLNQTSITEVSFKECKLLGLHFDHCHKLLFSANFVLCTLDHSSFYQLKMKGTTFENCSLREVDFTEAELSGSIFLGCDLSDAKFENTNLEKSDFTSAFQYIIDPEQNSIKGAKFSAVGLAGLLARYNIVIE